VNSASTVSYQGLLVTLFLAGSVLETTSPYIPAHSIITKTANSDIPVYAKTVKME